MKLPPEKLRKVDYHEEHLFEDCTPRYDWDIKKRDRIVIHWKPEPIVGEWVEWGVLYYLFGWLRNIKSTPSLSVYTFRRQKEPVPEKENIAGYTMQSSCRRLLKQLRKLEEIRSSTSTLTHPDMISAN